ncbi:MAG: ABC transporter ATP-binding protein [Candidatus Heimdallarchaeota archaeon]|nr:ABC transporter ATP-binding protein [Candidatus Heimdallarchaeota archaeon]
MNIKLSNILLNFGENVVLDNLSLEFDSNKVNCLLGRSGSGKTSILRIIAGVSPEFTGEVYFGNINATNQHPRDRNVGWVPQEQLLFPSLDIRGNIEYGLVARGIPKETRNKRVNEIVKLVGLDHLINRSPDRLSGGERQRVALGRALAPEPQVLLMDEPFSSLDAPERDRLSIVFKEIQLETGITSIHVTHSAREAEMIGDKIYVLSNGKIAQENSVEEIFQNPRSIEVARILGVSNLIEPGQLEGVDFSAIIPEQAIKIDQLGHEATVISATRENIHLILGTGLKITLKNQGDLQFNAGEKIKLSFDQELFFQF